MVRGKWVTLAHQTAVVKALKCCHGNKRIKELQIFKNLVKVPRVFLSVIEEQNCDFLF